MRILSETWSSSYDRLTIAFFGLAGLKNGPLQTQSAGEKRKGAALLRP
jgi:hypothetical protein